MRLHPDIRHQLKPRNLVLSGIGAIIVMSFLTIMTITIEYAYYRATPAQWNVKYFDVVPEKPYFSRNESLYFISDRQVSHDTNVAFNDTLFCDRGDGIFYYSSSAPGANRFLQIKERKPILWRYPHLAPADAKKCFLRSQIIEYRPYFIVKSQELFGEEFEVRR